MFYRRHPSWSLESWGSSGCRSQVNVPPESSTLKDTFFLNRPRQQKWPPVWFVSRRFESAWTPISQSRWAQEFWVRDIEKDERKWFLFPGKTNASQPLWHVWRWFSLGPKVGYLSSMEGIYSKLVLLTADLHRNWWFINPFTLHVVCISTEKAWFCKFWSRKPAFCPRE